MERISDFEFNIAMKIAANRSLSADVEEFMQLDIEDTVVDAKVKKRVSRKLRFDSWKDIRRISANSLKYASILVMCVTTVFFAVAMSIQPVRAAFFCAIVTWYDEYVDVRFHEEEETVAASEDEFVIMKPTYLPDGYEISYEYSDNVMFSCNIINQNDGFIRYSLIKDHDNSLWIDNAIYYEHTVYLKEKPIEVTVFKLSDNEYVLLWVDRYLHKLESENICIDEIIKIANSVN